MSERYSNDVVVNMQNVRTVFNGKVVHDDINLQIHKGEVLVLLGGSGSGKSTLMRALVGLLQPNSGQCLYKDKNIFELRAGELAAVRQKIAYIFQGGALFDSITVGENLEFPLIEHTDLPKHERRKRASSMLERLGLGEIMKLYPGELSGGMQKRLGVARALMLDPEVVIFDEPTAGLDPANIRRINDIILDLRERGISCIVITHDELCAKAVADRYAFLKGGKIEAIQRRADLEVKPEPVFAEYFSGGID